MKKILFTLFFFMLFVGQSNALIINPLPDRFGEDDKTEVFDPSVLSTAIEGYDRYDKKLGSIFGFFFMNDQNNLITIFERSDWLGTSRPTAKIDFESGIVYDYDEGNIIQNRFSPNKSNIGFFLQPDTTHTLYTVASMNENRLDVVATFPNLKISNNYLLGFENPYCDHVLAFEHIKDFSPVPVPEPETLILIWLGLIFATLFMLVPLKSTKLR